MILLAKPVPWYRDRGLIAGFVFCAFVLSFNLTQHAVDHQITGTLAAAPVLAAVLVVRAGRVLFCTAVAILTVLLVVWLAPGGEWDSVQGLRITLVVICGLVGFAAARIRLKDRSQLVSTRDIARSAQRAIMISRAPTVNDLDAAVRYASATEFAYIGGDGYETAETDYGLRLLVADARGKGLTAIRTSAITIGAFREWAYESPGLGEVLLHMDASLARHVDADNFVTAIVVELNQGRFRYCSAGHPLPLLLRSGCVTKLEVQPSPPLSMVTEGGTPKVEEINLLPDDLVLLYTDGLTEARDRAGCFFPLEAVFSRIAKEDQPIEEIAEALISELREFVASRLDDDVAFVMLRQK